MRVCNMDDCDRKHVARGLCGTHYNQTFCPDRHRKVEVACDGCGKAVAKEASRSNRYANVFCTYACRDAHTHAEVRASKQRVAVYRAPSRLGRMLAAATPHVTSTHAWTAGTCKECSAPFVDNQPMTRFCGKVCARVWHRRDWKRRTNRIVDPAVRALVYARDAGICQLCFEVVDMDAHYLHPHAPTVDHIMCQSWTSEPDHGVNNLRLAHRICNAARGDEGHGFRRWAAAS
ncbi:hypothetical protein SAMN05443544_0569 [Agromyces cerinus subsp. cerinus]|uniref:HNH endonuclease n=1 Tax=Agromyces cerinus subsp. cerinus TaxID=232089 RepID=A0A1N6DPV9_9MICO|nr:hypothetical protein SAMN05443544_0569 [Agromyces cerinus subsp. cerinus]